MGGVQCGGCTVWGVYSVCEVCTVCSVYSVGCEWMQIITGSTAATDFKDSIICRY